MLTIYDTTCTAIFCHFLNVEVGIAKAELVFSSPSEKKAQRARTRRKRETKASTACHGARTRGGVLCVVLLSIEIATCASTRESDSRIRCCVMCQCHAAIASSRP